MGFKENLKAELSYQNVLVKELAEKTGISKRTIDNYLRDKHSDPTAENAVKIAQALGVSAEYLVTGRDNTLKKDNGKTICHIVSELQNLDAYALETVLYLSKRLGKNASSSPQN